MATVPPECPFEDFIQSDLFTFHIGKEKKRFLVHSKAVAATSEPFRALVTGNMAESQTRSAEIQDILPEDFARYLEYAYRRDYTVPFWVRDDNVVKGNLSASLVNNFGIFARTEDMPTTEEPLPPPPPPPPPPSDPEPEPEPPSEMPVLVNLVNWTPKKRGKKKYASPTFRFKFETRKYLPDGEPKASMLSLFVPQPNSAPVQDFTPIFLAHARLYTFANMRLIEPLRNLTLYKLHKTLLCFHPYQQRVGDIVQLIRYAYDNGKERDEDGTIDELRKLVVEYVVCESTAFEKHKLFVQLLEEGGEFVGDFWTMHCKE